MLNLLNRLHAPSRAFARSNSRSLKGQSVLDALDGPSNGRSNALDAALDGVLEEADVALPSGRPLGGLPGHALFGARNAHGERGECADAGDAEADVLGHTGSGDADGHFGGFVGVFWLNGDAVGGLVGCG